MDCRVCLLGVQHQKFKMTTLRGNHNHDSIDELLVISTSLKQRDSNSDTLVSDNGNGKNYVSNDNIHDI